VAVIAGITGQDGAYLAQKLLADGFFVYGLAKALPESATWRLAKLGIAESPNLRVDSLPIGDPKSVDSYLENLAPLEFYNLASHSSVFASGQSAYETALTTGLAPMNFLESLANHSPQTRYFQAGSSELFGDTTETPQNEDSKMVPRNIYGSAKLLAHWAAINFANTNSLFAANGILYNHESPLRSSEFVTRKITSGVAKIATGSTEAIQLGNLSATRDWGYAPEYVDAMRKILGRESPSNYIISSGKSCTVRQFVMWAFQSAGMDVVFEGEGIDERGYEKSSGSQIVSVDQSFFRVNERMALLGDPSKARSELGWEAQTSVKEIVRLMVESDLAEMTQGS
jgi:GDPmannose 4,6-dehydratase